MSLKVAFKMSRDCLNFILLRHGWQPVQVRDFRLFCDMCWHSFDKSSMPALKHNHFSQSSLAAPVLHSPAGNYRHEGFYPQDVNNAATSCHTQTLQMLGPLGNNIISHSTLTQPCLSAIFC
uniref:Uncharacterized protein n=1 Tax=Amphiprion percula TaxID=161767 RepID=A0A3P8U4T3_AMPPE